MSTAQEQLPLDCAPAGPPRRLRVIIADHHAPFRRLLAELLASEPGVLIVAATGDGREALRQAEALRPDIVLLDLELPGVDGLDAARWITSHLVGTRVVLLADDDSAEYLLAAQESGASAFLAKQWAGERLPHLLRTLANGAAHPPAHVPSST
jgi:DNA-binding NarL/FixJ family response regulator